MAITPVKNWADHERRWGWQIGIPSYYMLLSALHLQKFVFFAQVELLESAKGQAPETKEGLQEFSTQRLIILGLQRQTFPTGRRVALFWGRFGMKVSFRTMMTLIWNVSRRRGEQAIDLWLQMDAYQEEEHDIARMAFLPKKKMALLYHHYPSLQSAHEPTHRDDS